MGAKAFQHEVGTLDLVVIGQVDFGDGQVFQAGGLSAALAVEMYMQVVVRGMVVAVAKFVACAFSVFQDVNQVLFLEKHQRAENSRLVDAADVVFEFGHRQRTASLGQGFRHDDSIGRWSDAVLLE